MESYTSGNRLLNILPDPPEGKTGWPWTEETDPVIYNGLKNIPKISILTPSFNQGEFIEQTIRSVLLQNYPNLEFIIIDGGSKDNTVEIINKYSKWIKYWISEKDKGQSEAINKGMAKCEGTIFNWINSDDYYYPDCFKNLAESFSSDRVFVVAGNYRFFDDKGEMEDRIIEFSLRDTIEATIADVIVNQPSTFFRLDIIKSLGKIDEKLQYVMDQDIFKKYLFKYGQDNIKVIDKDLSHFRFHSKSKTFQYLFNNEYTGIFYSIAKKAGMKKHLELIKKIHNDFRESDYEFNYNFSGKDEILVKKSVNYYVFSKARKFFTEKNLESMEACIAAVEPEYLGREQRIKIIKLKIKSFLIRNKLGFLLRIIRNPLSLFFASEYFSRVV